MPYRYTVTVNTIDGLVNLYNNLDSDNILDNTLFEINGVLTIKPNELSDAINFWNSLSDYEVIAVTSWLRDQFSQHRTLDNAINAVNRYMGLYKSFEDYSQSFLIDNGYTDNIPDIIARHINWGDVSDELRYDYEIIEIESGVLIFSI